MHRLGFIDSGKTVDTLEHFAVFETIRKINKNETNVKMLQNIYSQTTARIHLDNILSDKFPVNGGVRQGDPILPRLFTAVMEEI